MMWHMLRRKLGDENFSKGMKLFYDNNKFKVASFTDIRLAMEEVSGLDLSDFFNQWVNRTGAPQLEISNINTDMYGGKYRINITIEQKQDAEAFNIDLPINIATEDGIESFVFNMFKKEQDFQIPLKSKPLKLVVDPQYDVFRILHPLEVPPTLSKIWGSSTSLIILPKKASKVQAKVNEEFATKWKNTDKENFEIIYDTELDKLPKDKTAWIIGFDNKFASELKTQLIENNSSFSSDSVYFENEKLTKKGNSFVFTLSKTDNQDMQNIFISIGDEKAIDGLLRKLPHYGKYSYLAFNGDEPTNNAKGQWPVLNSPLVKNYSKEASGISVIEPREALASFKPVFSEKRMMASVNYLASEELKGRGLGTTELDKAAEYIANEF